MKIFVPGKTFLVGEYAVLVGGPALGLATKPYFEFDWLGDEADTDLNHEILLNEKYFHPDSPAGLLLHKYKHKMKFYFKDHYLEKGVMGGFGRSTAEYLTALTPLLLEKKKGFVEILKEYKELHHYHEVKPSGMDLAFQYFGSITLADQATNFYQNFDWNFANLDFLVVSTGQKVPTYRHLVDLDMKTLSDLPSLSDQVTRVFAENKEADFLGLMKEWTAKLEEKGLTHAHSVELKNKLQQHQNILLVKPCGALGADVLLVFFNREHGPEIAQYLQNENLLVTAGSDELSHGYASQMRNFGSEHVDRILSPV